MMGASSAGGGMSGRGEERTDSAKAKIKAACRADSHEVGIHNSSSLDGPIRPRLRGGEGEGAVNSKARSRGRGWDHELRMHAIPPANRCPSLEVA